ncbi:glycosyltransferase family 1 protein [Curtobacterium sp. VKM Ac-2887]|nr:glycosyltransferase family 1 protein [Curtobacterium sp. VKM Ac-2887]
MMHPAIPSSPASSPLAAEYQEIARGDHATGTRGTIRFAVSTDDPTEGKGDLFVALGLARALRAEGWGVDVWPIRRWAETVPEDTTVLVSMIESFVPGLVPARTATVAWVRNWTAQWASVPYLAEFDAVWASSTIARDELARVVDVPVEVVPIGVDLDLFTTDADGTTPSRTGRTVTTVNFWGARRGVQDVLQQVAPPEPIVWFAVNVEHVDAAPGVELRPAVSYFALPEVYRAAAFVVDDVIAPAAEFGTLNSRLYESLACGALPVTSCALGLDELGLADVPVFTDAPSLERAIAMSTAERDALVARLGAVVLERHSYAARAVQVGPLLDAATSHASARTGAVDPLLRWAAQQRELLRATEQERDVHRAGVEDINRRLIVSEEAVAVLDRARKDAEQAQHDAEAERDAIATRYDTLTHSAEFRALDRLGGVARALRRRA